MFTDLLLFVYVFFDAMQYRHLQCYIAVQKNRIILFVLSVIFVKHLLNF